MSNRAEYDIHVSGYLVGNTWWPNAECWKWLDYHLSDEDSLYIDHVDRRVGSLRDHMLRATNEGDFQYCEIAHGRVSITMRRVVGGKLISRIRHFPLSMFPSVADLLHDDPDWTPCGE